MLFSFSLKSSVLLIFFFHGIVFSVTLFVKGIQAEKKSSLWLSLFTLLSSLYITPFMLGYAGWYSEQPYRDFLFYTPFQQLLLLPPVLYFYIQTLLDKSFKFSKRDYVHFIPAAGYLVYCLVMLLVDKVFLNEHYFYADGRDKDFSSWYQITGLFFMAYYLIISLKTYYRYKTITYNVLSFADLVMFKWAKRFLIAFLILITLRLIFFIVNPEWDEFGRKFWYYLSFSALFYYISISGYTNSLFSATSFKDSPLDSEPYSKPENHSVEKAPINKLAEEKNEIQDLEFWKERIEGLMLNDKMYENPELVISDMSSKLNTHSKNVSQAINQGFKMNFNDFVNHYRIRALLLKIENGEHNIKTLLALALECGFNSKSTFNRAFKRSTSQTPKEYILKQG